MVDDAELEAALGDTVVARQTVAEWPLSRTEKVVFAGGRFPSTLGAAADLPETPVPFLKDWANYGLNGVTRAVQAPVATSASPRAVRQ